MKLSKVNYMISGANKTNSQAFLRPSSQVKVGPFSNIQSINSNSQFSSIGVKPSSILGKFTRPDPNSFLAIISNKEVIKTKDSTKSIQQYQVTVSKDNIGESNNNNLMATPTTWTRVTGDQIIQEVRIIGSKKTHINPFSSLISPKNINLSSGGL